MPKYQSFDITAAALFKILLFVVGAFLLWRVLDIIGAIFVAVVIAAAIDPPVRWLQFYKVPRVLAVLLVYVLFIFVILFSAYNIIPQFSGEVQHFLRQSPALLEELQARIEDHFTLIPLDELFTRLRAYAASAGEFTLEGATRGLFEGASAIFNRAFTVLVIFIISFYLTVQENGVAKFLRLVSPEEYDEYVVDLWSRSQRKIERWLQGQLLLAIIVGSLVYIGLTLLGVRFALSLALIAAFLELIPFFGPILATVPGVMVAALQDPLLGLFTLILYIGVQQLENHLIYPVVVSKMIGVAPMVAIVALLIGGRLAGIFGLILAIPIVVILIEILDDRAARKHRNAS